MESWMCNSQGKCLTMPDGIIPYTDDMTRIKGTPTKWELEGSFNNDGTVLFSGQDVTESLKHVESCAGSTKKTFSGSVVELFGKSTTHLQVTNTSHSFNEKAFSGEKETGSKNSSSVIDSDSKESTTIDLKLGRFSDCRYSKKCNSIRDAETFKSFASPIPAKRIRSTSLNVQTPFCQVFNCNMDLSSLKDYYKRHKVCEIHSKTSVVIVNGIEQRFCQQCSRFHLLDAFDAGKRSCRKRLAGHNERRRKPQIDINSARTGRMTQPYHDMFPCGILQGASYENANWQGQAQSRESTLSCNAPLNATVDGQLIPRSLNTAVGTQKHFPSDVINAINPDGIHVNQCEVGFGALTFVVDDQLHDRSLPVVSSVPTCAHSLLSSQPHRSYLHSSDVSASGQPLLFQDGNVQCGKVPYLGKALAVESQASSSVIPSSCNSSRMNNLQDQQIGILGSYSNNDEGFDVHSSGNRFMTTEDNFADESGHTIDLLQLSSLLQNAEERRSVQVKQESDRFKSFPNV